MGLIRAGIVGGKTNSTARPGTDKSGSNRAERQIFLHCKCFVCRIHRCLSAFKIQEQTLVVSTYICL